MLLALLLILFVLSLFAPLINTYIRRYSGWILGVVPFMVFLFFITRIPQIAAGDFIHERYHWIADLGIVLSFKLDGLSQIFALLVSGIGSLILIYAGYYMRSYEKTSRFFGYLVFFMASMLGLVLAADLLTLFVFWEFTSLSSFLLIGFKHEKTEARQAALQALLITGLGGLALLAAFVLLHSVYGTFELSIIIANPDLLAESPRFLPILILILLGAFTKSAIFPFHFWLPGAMQAPSPVSAYLHSATMVKAGIYLLARLNPLMMSSEWWVYSLSLFGVFTMFVGAWMSITQNDLKKVLAYTTVSALGTLVMLIGSSTDFAVNAMLVFLLVHAFYKATLFMMAGNIEKKTGTRMIDEVGGLYRYMPVASVISLLALLSMSGIPPMLGFISKELIYEAGINAPSAAGIILLLGFLSNTFILFASARIALDVFLGKPMFEKQPREPDVSLLTGPAILVTISLLLGLLPGRLTGALLNPAMMQILPGSEAMNLKLWHGFNMILLLSFLTILAGMIMYFYRSRVTAFVSHTNLKFFKGKFSEGFFGMIDGLMYLTARKTAFVQHGYHRFYLMTIFLVSSALISLTLIGWKPAPELFADVEIPPFSVLVFGFLIIIATLTTLFAKSRLVALIAIGLVGIGIGLIFIKYSGIDLAITMIMVETIMVVLGTIVVFHLPKYLNFSNIRSRQRDAVIASVFGLLMALLAFRSFSEPEDRISDYFLANSYLMAYGKNVVNVILVDFRALDTLGEITVLLLAAFGIYALLKLKTEKK
jgi:multicomponent Na+:H+ antiporter subunit A